jgi:chromosomal replication initiation ATPase DnaA
MNDDYTCDGARIILAGGLPWAVIPGGRITRRRILLYQAMPVLAETSERFRVSINELLSESRNQHVIIARWYAMAHIRKRFKLSTPQIGIIFGKNHATVLHGLQQHAKMEKRQWGMTA